MKKAEGRWYCRESKEKRWVGVDDEVMLVNGRLQEGERRERQMQGKESRDKYKEKKKISQKIKELDLIINSQYNDTSYLIKDIEEKN